LFYPYRDLGLVIIDEEHDPSYKSDNSPKVDIREIVLKMKEFVDFKLIFASGTPSIKTIYK
jgi:primosomal protein N' (replication factor Y)